MTTALWAPRHTTSASRSSGAARTRHRTQPSSSASAPLDAMYCERQPAHSRSRVTAGRASGGRRGVDLALVDLGADASDEVRHGNAPLDVPAARAHAHGAGGDVV